MLIYSIRLIEWKFPEKGGAIYPSRHHLRFATGTVEYAIIMRWLYICERKTIFAGYGYPRICIISFLERL